MWEVALKYLSALGGGFVVLAVIIAVAVWWVQALVRQHLQKDLDQYKADLGAAKSRELELIRAEQVRKLEEFKADRVRELSRYAEVF